VSSSANDVKVAKRSPAQEYGLSPEKVAFLVSISKDLELAYRVCLRCIHAETVRYLDSLAREVREGKNVLPAADYGRWLQFSGVLDLLTKFAPPDLDLPPLDRKLADLLQECGEHFRGGRVDAKYAQSDIAEINRKLDLLLSGNARPVSDVVIALHALPVKTETESIG
jgi:hypothetical protein